MFRARPTHASTSQHTARTIPAHTIHPSRHLHHFAVSLLHDFTTSFLPPRLSALNPVESALPQNPFHHSANPIESTPFFRIAQFRTNSASVTPAYTTLTKHPSRNPIRMNTSTEHQVAPPPAIIATDSYKTLYRKIHTTRSCHFPHANPWRRTPPFPVDPRSANARLPRPIVVQDFSAMKPHRVTPIESHCFMSFPSNPFRMILFHRHPGGGGGLGFSNQKFRMGEGAKLLPKHWPRRHRFTNGVS